MVRACIVNSLMAKAGPDDNLKTVVESKMAMLDLASALFADKYPLCTEKSHKVEVCEVIYALQSLNINELSLKTIEIFSVL